MATTRARHLPEKDLRRKRMRRRRQKADWDELACVGKSRDLQKKETDCAIASRISGRLEWEEQLAHRVQ
ncbi:hypothetical protein PR003_g32075 [Phytophthora rubi]|uniref:Uncharacterized protein n=1 Tax=Phytophthora rubi TaxID=129364 RepID=A0A6A4B5D2_9STRA|nr:hypothetical protein PR003_g32075 [Phytophthora rubi]